MTPAAPVAENPQIAYELAMSQPHTHLLEVSITLSNLENAASPLDLIMPVWRAGRYRVLDFAGGVQEFSAHGAERSGEAMTVALAWSKTEKSTWRIQTAGHRVVQVRYKVYANEFAQRTRGLNDQHAFVNGCAAFMYIEKYRMLPLTLRVRPYGDWHVSTGLERVAGETSLFHAPNYDDFVDCPLEIGTQQDFEFEVHGRKHTLSIFGTGNWDAHRLVDRLQHVVRANHEFWGDLPYPHYTFLVHSTPNSGGGTEHLNSTIMGINQFAFNGGGGYEGFTSLAMHEFFHTWNVKQLRPSGLQPYDWTRENYSRLLWVAEGTTSYYTMILLRRAGFTSIPALLDRLAGMVRSDRQRPGRSVQSLEESSFDAWIKFWHESPNDQNSEVSYYEKGAAVSMLLDLEIRQRTQNRASLDQVMRTLYRRFPRHGPGYTPEDLERVVAEVGEGDYSDFFAQYVRGCTEIDFAKFYRYAGLELVATPAPPEEVFLGVAAQEQGGSVMVQRVFAGTAAYDAGLDAGDEIIALNGYRLWPGQLSRRLADFKPGSPIRLMVFRDDRLREFEITLRARSVPDYHVRHVSDPSPLQRKIHASWLNAAWPGEEK